MLSIYRIKYSKYIYMYDANSIDLLTISTEDFKNNYDIIYENLNIDNIEDLDKLYNELKECGIYLKISDVIKHNNIYYYYYYDDQLVKFDVFDLYDTNKIWCN